MKWLILRGLMRQKKHWGDFPEKFAKMTGVDDVVCLDLPGVGTETGRIFIPQLSEVVKDLRRRLLEQEPNLKEEKWAIMGHSLGGMIAMQWVHDFPEDFDRLVIMSSSSREFPIWKRLRLYSVAKILEIFVEKDIRKREKKTIDMISNLKKDDVAVLNEWTQIEKETPSSKAVAVQQLLGASLFKLPNRIKIPTLVLASRADRMVNFYCSQMIAKRYKSAIHVHPTSGHDLVLDDGAWVLEKIKQWTETKAI